MNRKDAERSLKDLKLLIEGKKKAITECCNRQSKLQKALNEHENEMSDILLSLNKDNDKIEVTDHALVRYLEKRFDLEQFRKEILTDINIQAIKAGADSISVNSQKFVIKNNKVITVI